MFLAAVMAVAAGSVSAQEEKLPLSLDVTADFYSAYVWRGLTLDKHAVFQPGATGTLTLPEDAGAISAGVWLDWDLSQKSKHTTSTRTGGGINELDFTLAYAKDFGPVGFEIGNIWYTFPGGGWTKHSYSTEELYLGLAYNNDVVTPSFTVYYDYNAIGDGFLSDNPFKDLYGEVALSKEVAINEQFTVGGTASLGAGASHYNAGYCGMSPDGHGSDEGFSNYQLAVNAAYKLNDTFTIGATLAFTGLIGGDWGIDRHNLSPDEIVWGGINLKASF
jgi:hypothetical protein